MTVTLLLIVFSRSYCYTVWSAIGKIWHHPVVPLSVRPSVCFVCLSVTLCILALRVGVQG